MQLEKSIRVERAEMQSLRRELRALTAEVGSLKTKKAELEATLKVRADRIKKNKRDARKLAAKQKKALRKSQTRGRSREHKRGGRRRKEQKQGSAPESHDDDDDDGAVSRSLSPPPRSPMRKDHIKRSRSKNSKGRKGKGKGKGKKKSRKGQRLSNNDEATAARVVGTATAAGSDDVHIEEIEV